MILLLNQFYADMLTHLEGASKLNFTGAQTLTDEEIPPHPRTIIKLIKLLNLLGFYEV